MTTRTLTAAAFLLLAACDGGPEALGPAAGGESLHAQSSAVARGQRSAIEEIVAARAAAWIDKDAVAYAASFTEDGLFINPLGGLVIGRAAVQAQHAFLFPGPFAGSSQTETIVDIRFITGTVALVRLEATLTGFAALPPGLAEAEPGVVRTRVTWLVVKERGEWRIDYQHMTAVQPGV